MCRALALLALAHPLTAQDPARPYLEWRTIRTAHFSFHYPAPFEVWTRRVAEHMESVDSAVTRLVGFTPAHRADVVIDDPYDIPNGSALPFLDAPVLTFWPVPPGPREDIGNWRDWGELLSAHEFAHLAHLARPSRNPLDRLVWRLMPADVGPLVLKAPRWAIEGYATFVEGRITGNGRPNGAWRAAILRQWAIEGHLPTYDQLSSWSAYDGGDFAYLAGSAYLDWLAAQHGDSSLTLVWRRATARVERTFDESFAGVFGDSPQVLYGRFTAQLTAQAMAVQSTMDTSARGVIEQHLSWGTGDPAFSRDGSRVAIVLRAGNRPPRTVIWSTAAARPDSAAIIRERELLARDPEDVAARRVYPPPRTAIASLDAVGGAGFLQPRFLDDTHVLVSRSTEQPDGTFRPDLYIWDTAHGGVRRVTHGAAVEDADPAPNGEDAIGTRCHDGGCDVVRVNLRTGLVATVLSGQSVNSYYRPRYSPDGTQFVVSATSHGHWRLMLAHRDGSALAPLPFDDGANRYDATFTPSGDTLVYVSDRGGMINLAASSVGRPREVTLTNVTGAAVGPAVNPVTGAIWFLSLHARGYDVRALRPPIGAAHPVNIVGEFGAASPPVPPTRDPMAVNPVDPPVAYALGPRRTRYLPGESLGPDGFSASASATNTDVIGRLTAIATGAYGARPQENGAGGALAWRGSRVEFDLALHEARQLPSHGSAGGAVGTALDLTRTGGAFAAAFDLAGDEWDWRARAGAGLERLSPTADPTQLTRSLAFAEWDGVARQSSGRRTVFERLATHMDGGRTGTDQIFRVVMHAGFGTDNVGPLPLRGAVTYGHMSGSSLPVEQFTAGGLASSLIDSSLAASRYAVPLLPYGAVMSPIGGRSSALFAARASMPIGLISPFYETVSIGDGRSFDYWHRSYGVVARFAVGALSQAFIPALEIQLGVGRSLDAPYARRASVFSAIRFHP